MTQTMLVLSHLIAYRHITPLEAHGVYKVRSLSSQVSRLKKAGYKIKKMFHKDATGQRYAKYYYDI